MMTIRRELNEATQCAAAGEPERMEAVSRNGAMEAYLICVKRISGVVS